MKIFFILILLTISVQLFAQDTELDKLIRKFDYNKITDIYTAQVKNADSYRLLQLSYALSVTADGYFGFGSKGEKHASEAVNFGLRVNRDKLRDDEKIPYYYYMAKVYNRLINDAAGWMKYNKSKDEYLNLLLEADPDHIGGKLIQANNYLNMPSGAGGDPEKGYRLLISLEEKYPENYEILDELIQYYIENNNNDKTEECLKKIIAINPDHTGAKNQLKELQIMRQNLKIGDITLKEGVKTNNKRILKKVKPFVGKIYNQENKTAIADSAGEISSITGVKIKSNPILPGEVDLEISADEDNTKMIGGTGCFKVTPDYNFKPEFNGIPAVIYMDRNFLGTGDQLQVIYAGIYLNADYSLNGLFTDSGPAVNASVTALAISMDHGESYINGKQIDDFAVYSPEYSAKIAIGKEFEVGLSAFLANSIQYHIWKTDENDVTTPSHKFTYTGSLPVSFSTLDNENPSRLILSEGFSVSVNPEIIYKSGYGTWGNKYNPKYSFDHDSDPMFRFQSDLAYFFTFLERHNAGANITYMTGYNFYQSEKRTAGSVMMIMPSPELNGYYESEFDFKSGILANFSYALSVIPGTWTIFARHDILYNIDNKDIYHGSALGSAFQLPYEIEVAAKLGIGWNAERKDDAYGYDFQVSVMKMHFF